MERPFRQVLQDVLTDRMKQRIAQRYNLKPGQDPVAAFEHVVSQLQANHGVQPTAEDAQQVRNNMAKLAGLQLLRRDYP